MSRFYSKAKDPDRAQWRAAALAAIDPDWNPREHGWTVDWQRHYSYLTQLLAEGAPLTAIVPGVTRHGEAHLLSSRTERYVVATLNHKERTRSPHDAAVHDQGHPSRHADQAHTNG
ncbi:hypothetical protein [Streptomyces zhihengii]|uniref:hypothetical protein n=1 Tax=Streptomyces zhihengii TaxID=1818004 RepID=UPI00339E6D6D